MTQTLLLLLSFVLPAGAQDLRQASTQELREVLSTGRWKNGSAVIRPFVFRHPNGLAAAAQSAGLEGFLYTKRGLEARFGDAFLHQLPDCFSYLDSLLSLAPWTGETRKALSELSAAALPDKEKNAKLDALLQGFAAQLGKEFLERDKAQWARKARIYQIFPRAYNLKGRRSGEALSTSTPREVFFRDFEASDFGPIKDKGFDAVWPLGLFPIGERGRWGTGGGSPYSIRDHRTVEPSLGSEADFKRFVRLAHEAGLKVIIDFVPNHTSMDSVLLKEDPSYYIHRKPDPKADKPPKGWFLVKHKGRKLWVHHGGYEVFGDLATWDDTAQVDYSRPETRRRMAQIVRSWVERFDVDGFRVDMAYQDLNHNFGRNWGVGMPKAEFFEELFREVRSLKPETGFIAEAYADQDMLSAVGFDAVYNKWEDGRLEGQTGWYDALAGGNPAEALAALDRAAFLSCRTAGAGSLVFVGNHDEKAPRKIFGERLPAAALATALLPGAFLFYNGQEIGFDKAVPWEHKTLPFSTPVRIDWSAEDPALTKLFSETFSAAKAVRAELGDYCVEPLRSPEPAGWTGFLMESRSRPGLRKAFISDLGFKPVKIDLKAQDAGLTLQDSLEPGLYRLKDIQAEGANP